MLNRLFMIILLAVILSCDKNDRDDELINCTMEFRVISVEVIGVNLTQNFTIRQTTQDTITFGEEYYYFDHIYPILSDDEHELLLNNDPEVFLFVGFVGDEKVIEEPYLIGSDKCHVDLIQGRASLVVD